MSQNELTIDYEVRDKASAALRDVERGLKRNQKAFGDLNKEAGEWNVEAVKAKGSTSGFGGSLGSLGGAVSKFAGPLAVATGGLLAFREGLQKTIELNEKLAEFQGANAKLFNSIANTGVGARQAKSQLSDLKDTIRALSEQTGAAVPELTEGMRELTTRTGDAAKAADNMQRVVALANLKGDDFASVAKDLGDALNGDLAPLKELGILSDQQIEHFQGMSDKGAAVAQAMAVLDQKTKGFASGLPDSVKNAGRLTSALDRLESAFADLVGVDEIVGAMASGVEGVTHWVEDFVEAWEKAPQRIRDAKKEIDKLPSAPGQDQGAVDPNSFEFRNKLQARLIKDAKWKAAQARRQLKARKLGWMQEQQALKEIDQREQDRILAIKEQYHASKTANTANWDAKIKIQKLEGQILKAKSEQQKYELTTLKQIQEIAYQRQKDLNAAQGEAAKEKVRTYYATKINNLLLKRSQQWDDIAKSRDKATGDAQKTAADMGKQQAEGVIADFKQFVKDAEKAREDNFKAAKAAMDQRQSNEALLKQWRQDDLSDLQVEKAKALSAEQKILIDRKMRLIELDGQHLDAVQEANAKKLIELDTEQKLLEVARQRRDKAIQSAASGVSNAFGSGASLLGQAVSDLGDQNKAQQKSLELLQRKISAYGQLSSTVGDLGTSLSDIASQQWNFGKAVDASVGGINALSSAGGAVASIMGDSVKDQSKIRAEFEAAAAVAAAAAGLFFPDPRYWASAAQHAAAATMFGVISGSAPNVKTGAGASGGGAGASGGGSKAQQFDFQRAYEIQKRANLEALREARQESRSVTNIFDYRGSYNLNDHPTSRRNARRALRGDGQLVLGGT